jgi:SAM-dependent methyltransferase
MWREIYRAGIKRYIQKSDVVMDIGAGYGEFINVVECKKRIAVDPNPDTKHHVASGVVVVPKTAVTIPRTFDGTIDVVWLSNVLEHMQTKQLVQDVLDRVYRLVKPGGRVIILQPNIDLVGTHYWDFIDHHVALNGPSVREALSISGFQNTRYIKRFLPYTTKGKLPVWPWLIAMYLRVPSFLRPYAGQSLFIATKDR